MQDVLYIDDVARADALLKPLRVELLKRMVEPRSCTELAAQLGETPQKLYYHVKVLEREGLVVKVRERRVGGIMEGLYQAVARSYWLSPRLVGRAGGQNATRDAVGLGFLLTLAEELQADVARLAESPAPEVPSLGLAAVVELRDPAERRRFMRDVQAAFQSLAERYGARERTREAGQPARPAFRLMLACYPQPDAPDQPAATDLAEGSTR